MALHVARREPRAHWVLLLLGVLVLLGGLCFNGFANQVGGSTTQAPRTGPQPVAPKEVTGGGPVIRVAPDGRAETRSMPAGTVALTFDDGPDPKWTPRLLDVLKARGVRATFFVVGSKVNKHPDLVRRMVAEGHEVGVHTFSHTDMTPAPAWRRAVELNLTLNAVSGAAGIRPTLFRPPYSSGNDAVTGHDYAAIRDVAEAGYLTVLSDHDTKDWRRPGVDAILAAATPQPGRGAVVLMHDSGGDRTQTLAAVEKLVSAPGLRFTTVSQGLGLPAAPSASSGERLRGTALRWAQQGSAILGRLMEWLLAAAVVLGVLRLAMQVVTAHLHRRRARRRARQRLRYLGPVSVVVPAYNEAANIAATVRSLVASDYPKLEVIVVDDGSSDGTADIVERLNLRGVRVLRQENAGKPAALNNGIAHARGDFLILVDGDTVFESDAVGRLVQQFADPRVGAISGNTKVANRRGLLGRWQHLEYVIGFNLDRRMFDIAECMPTIPGAIGAFRREVLIDVGGVSSQTLAEDTDLTMAVLRAGWKVVYEESAIAWTEAPSSLRQLWRQRYRWCYGTMQAMWKHRHAIAEPGPGGKLGRRGVGYLLTFQVVLPLAAPAVDAYAVYGLVFLPWSHVIGVWGGFVVVQALTAAYALRLDGERLGPLWSLPFQQVVYRQMMYLVVVQSTVTALLGNRLRWQRMVRTGAASAVLARN